jgi:hypothetical protein
VVKRRNVMLWDRGSGYRAYVFEESTRRCAIDCKGRGRKEVIYLRVADISCTRGIRESTGLSYGGPYGRVL